MEIRIMGKKGSLFSQYLGEIRDVRLQGDPIRFRRNMERLGSLFAYEISRGMKYKISPVKTPLGKASAEWLAESPVVGTILRAGLAMHSGFTGFFDRADSAFVSAYRKHESAENFTIRVEYLSSPRLENRTLILCDPMLATGQSMVLAHRALLEKGRPIITHFVSVVGSRQGVRYLRSRVKTPSILWLVAVDERLDKRAYIVPGLGDAGDLAYGKKN